MTYEIAVVFVVVIGAIILFTIEKIPVDLSALIVMAVLLITGIITPEEGIAGFSNSATVTVGAMFILSSGLFRTGALNFVGDFLGNATGKNLWIGVLFLMIIAGGLSAFINDTAVVALFMPVVINVARKTKISPSKFLMPLSFGALFGGVCTLVGTSTNILVSSIAYQHGQKPFGMFEMTPLGIIILIFGILYMFFIGVRILPERRGAGDLTEYFDLSDYITEIIIQPNAISANKKIKNSALIKDLDIEILEIQRGENYHFFPSTETVLRSGDILKVRCNIEKLKQLQVREGIKLKSDKKYGKKDLSFSETRMVEAVVTPNSRLRGRTIKQVNFRETFGATVLAIRHRGKVMNERIGHTPLLPGDVLLIEVKKDWLNQLKQNSAFVIVSEVTLSESRKSKIIPAVAILAGVVVAAALNILPIAASAIIGSVLLVVTGCITLEEAYKAIDWKVIFLLAGVLTLGIALEKTGAAMLISSFLIYTIGGLGNTALLSSFFLLTLILTNFMSNNATAALLVPIAILTANSIGVNPRPFLMAVTYAASLSIMTPVGYQTNIMILGPGNYRFLDFVKVGTPLDIIFWILATFLIPVFFPF